eukprot:1153099-Pelagomonas_calceolata.AAC.3
MYSRERAVCSEHGGSNQQGFLTLTRTSSLGSHQDLLALTELSWCFPTTHVKGSIEMEAQKHESTTKQEYFPPARPSTYKIQGTQRQGGVKLPTYKTQGTQRQGMAVRL